MRRIVYNSLIFAAAFGIGLSAICFSGRFESEAPADMQTAEIIQAIPDQGKDYTREFTFSSISAEEETDTTFFAFVDNGKVTLDDCYSDYGVGDEPLALMKRGNQYSLEQVKLEQKKHVKSDLRNYITAKFKDSKNALIVVKGSKNLKPGPVQTAYLKPEISDYDPEPVLRLGSRQEMKLGDRVWAIRAGLGINTTDGKNLPMIVTVLESEGRKQPIWYTSEYTPDNAAWIEWAGDLDGDGLLDFLLSFFETNGGSQTSILFLSSKAKDDELVRPYAFFSARIGECAR